MEELHMQGRKALRQIKRKYEKQRERKKVNGKRGIKEGR